MVFLKDYFLLYFLSLFSTNNLHDKFPQGIYDEAYCMEIVVDKKKKNSRICQSYTDQCKNSAIIFKG